MLRKSAEPVLFFLLGVCAFLLLEAALSFHASHCTNQYQQTESPKSVEPNAISANPQSHNRRTDKKQDDHSAKKVICGVTGLYGLVSVMDAHEGFFVGLFTFCLFIATLFLWGSTNSLWDASEKQLIATQRPWVKVDAPPQIISDLIFEHGEGRIDLLFTISNKGNSPGLRVRINVKLVASNQISLLSEQQEFSATFRNDPAPGEVRPEITSWSGGDTITFPVRAWLSSTDMPRFKVLSDSTPFPITLLAIIGCIDYEFDFASGHHQTGIIYDLRKNTPYTPGQFGIYTAEPGAVMLNDGIIIPQRDLSVSIGFVGTGPVD